MTEEVSKEKVAEQAEEIVSDGERITERISNLVLETLKSAENGIQKFGTTVDGVIDGAMKSVEKSVPEDPESSLRQVYTGLTDAGEKAAESIKLTFEEAKARGQSVTEEEYKRVVENLSILEEELRETIENFVKRSSSEFSDMLKNAMEHASRASSDMRTSVQSALEAAKNHPTELVKESAQAGIDLSRDIASRLLGSAAKALDAAAQSLGGETQKDSKEEGSE